MIAANDQEPVPITAELDLIAYLDGELDEEKLLEIEAKLESDPEYRAQLRALEAVADFVRDDAERIYAASKIDSIADEVMAQLSRPRNGERVSALPMSALPTSSLATRKRKNSVIWVAFGTVTAAAAALFVYVGRQPSPAPNQPSVAAQTQTAPPDTVAVKSPAVVPSKDQNPALPPIEESRGVEVEDLEVGEGATVIYADHLGAGASAVVWVNGTK